MQKANAQDNEFLTTSPTAREFEVSPQTVIEWERKGILSAIKTANGLRLFRRSDIEKLKQARNAKRG